MAEDSIVVEMPPSSLFKFSSLDWSDNCKRTILVQVFELKPLDLRWNHTCIRLGSDQVIVAVVNEDNDPCNLTACPSQCCICHDISSRLLGDTRLTDTKNVPVIARSTSAFSSLFPAALLR